MAGKRKYQNRPDSVKITEGSYLSFEKVKDAVNKFSDPIYSNQYVEILYDHPYYDESVSIEGIEIGGNRLETDDEYLERLRVARQAKAAVKQRALDAKAKVEEEERRQLAILQAKYGSGK